MAETRLKPHHKVIKVEMFNGQIGYVSELDPDIISMDDGTTIDVASIANLPSTVREVSPRRYFMKVNAPLKQARN